MRTLLLLILAIASVLFGCNCRNAPPLRPQPTSDLEELVDRSITQWLDVRITDPQTLPLLFAEGVEWRETESLFDLADWFVAFGESQSDPVLWDISRLITLIKKSQLARGISDKALLGLMKASLAAYYKSKVEAPS